MNPTVLVILIGGIILLWPQISQAFTTGAIGGRTGTGGRLPPTDGTLFPPDGPLDGPTVPGAPGGSVGTRIAGSGAGMAALLGASHPYVAAVILAGSFIAWGITQKGWFRGGEEGVIVNPERDEFKSLFAHLNPYSSSCSDSNGPGFYGLAWLLNQLGRDDLMTKFNEASNRSEFEAAVNEIDMLMASSAPRVAELVNYTIAAGFPGAACTPNPSLPWEV